MRITDQSQTDDVRVTFVEGDDGRAYIHWLSLSGGNSMVFVVVDDADVIDCIHKFVLRSGSCPNSLGAPALGASFTVTKAR